MENSKLLPSQNIQRKVQVINESTFKVDLLDEIDTKIALCESPQEMALYIRLRKEVLKQNNEQDDKVEDKKHNKRSFIANLVVCGSFLGVGTLLIFSGFSLPGFFIAGGSLAMIVPNYVSEFINKFKDKVE